MLLTLSGSAIGLNTSSASLARRNGQSLPFSAVLVVARKVLPRGKVLAHCGSVVLLLKRGIYFSAQSPRGLK